MRHRNAWSAGLAVVGLIAAAAVWMLAPSVRTERQLARLNAPDPASRCRAMCELRHVRDPKFIAVVCRLLRDDSTPAVRLTAAGVLAEQGDGSCIAPLRAALADGDPRVRCAAAFALVQLGASAAHTTPAQSRDAAISLGALAARARSGAFDEVLPMFDYLRDPDPVIRTLAARHLDFATEHHQRAFGYRHRYRAADDPNEFTRAAAEWRRWWVESLGRGSANELVTFRQQQAEGLADLQRAQSAHDWFVAHLPGWLQVEL